MRKRDRAITIRATSEENEQIRANAARAGMGIAQYILKASIECKVYCVLGVADVVKEIKPIGNNINQIAHVANINGAVCVQELRKVQKELEKIWQLLRRLTQVEKG